MKIQTGGRPTHNTVTKGFVKQKRLRHKTVRKARGECNIPGMQIKQFLAIMKEDLGKDFIKPGLAEDMTNSNHFFDLNFKLEMADLEINPNPHGLLNDLFPTRGGGRFCPRFCNNSRWTTMLTKMCIMHNLVRLVVHLR